MSVERNAKVDPPVNASTTSIAPSQAGLAATSAYVARGAKMTPRIRAGKPLAAVPETAGATVCGISGLGFTHLEDRRLKSFPVPPAAGGRRSGGCREDFPEHAETALQPAPRRRIERREHFGEVHLGTATDPLERRAAGRGDLDHHDAAVVLRRSAPDPPAIHHRGDGGRHRRQADALERRQLGERTRPRVLRIDSRPKCAGAGISPAARSSAATVRMTSGMISSMSRALSRA